MSYRAHITKCIRESTFFRHHVEGALDELRDKYRKALLYDEIVKARKKVGTEIGLADYYKTEDFGRTVIDIVDRSDSQ